MSEETKKMQSEEKSLEKLTIKELTEIAMKIPHFTVVRGMKKSEIVAFIKDDRKIKDETSVENKKVIKSKVTKSELKANIRELKCSMLQALSDQDCKLVADFRQRIRLLKKKLRNVVRG